MAYRYDKLVVRVLAKQHTQSILSVPIPLRKQPWWRVCRAIELISAQRRDRWPLEWKRPRPQRDWSVTQSQRHSKMRRESLCSCIPQHRKELACPGLVLIALKSALGKTIASSTQPAMREDAVCWCPTVGHICLAIVDSEPPTSECDDYNTNDSKPPWTA